MTAHNSPANRTTFAQDAWLERILAVSLAVVVGLTLGSAIYVAEFYVHEAGHMFYGSVDGVLNHHPNRYTISNWAPVTVLGLPIHVPQQTRLVTGTPSAGFVLGGPILVVIVSGAACLVTQWKRKGRVVWLIFAALFLQELTANVLCGTDHLWPGTLTACAPDAVLGHWPTIGGLLLFGGCVLLVYPGLRATAPKWLAAIAQPQH